MGSQVDLGDRDSNLRNEALAGSSPCLEGICSVIPSCKQFLSARKDLEMIHGRGSGVFFLENLNFQHKKTKSR